MLFGLKRWDFYASYFTPNFVAAENDRAKSDNAICSLSREKKTDKNKHLYLISVPDWTLDI